VSRPTAAKVAPACPCGRTLVPLWRWDDLICPAGCRDDRPAASGPTKYWLPYITSLAKMAYWAGCTLVDKPTVPNQEGIWVVHVSGPKPVAASYGKDMWLIEEGSTWALAP
jgi:hypothetical protein